MRSKDFILSILSHPGPVDEGEQLIFHECTWRILRIRSGHGTIGALKRMGAGMVSIGPVAVARWIARYPYALIAAAICYCLGLVTMLPLGLSISESAAGFVGAIVGAVAGIGGALAVVHTTEFVQGKNIAEYIVLSYQPAIGQFEATVDAIENADARFNEREWSAEAWGDVIREFREGMKLIDEAKIRIHRVEPNAHRMASVALHLSNVLADRANDVTEAMSEVVERQSEAIRFYGGRLSDELRARFFHAARDMSKTLLELSIMYGLSSHRLNNR